MKWKFYVIEIHANLLKVRQLGFRILNAFLV